MTTNRAKKDKNSIDADDRLTTDLEYVGADAISLLFGVTPNEIHHKRVKELERKVRFRWNGHGRKYHFNDAARLAFPNLSDKDYAHIRIDINTRLLERKERKNATLGQERRQQQRQGNP